MFREKDIVIDCFTFRSSVYKYARIDHARNFFPKWWKDLEDTTKKRCPMGERRATAKTCHGIFNLFTRGFVVPMHIDTSIIVAEKGKLGWRVSSKDSDLTIIQHPEGQRGDFATEANGCVHLKYSPPWFLTTSESIELAAFGATYNADDIFEPVYVPGVPPVMKDHPFNPAVNFFLRRGETERQVDLIAGTAMYHMIPLTDRKIKMRHHLINRDRWYQMAEPYHVQLASFGGMVNNAWSRLQRFAKQDEG